MSYQVRFRALRVNPIKIDIEGARREVENYVQDFTQGIIDEVEVYPPVPPDSTYERRGFEGGLLGSWRHVTFNTANIIEHRIYNNAMDDRGRHYFAFVHGSWQTSMHAGTGWRRLDLAVIEHRKTYRRDLQAIYNRHIRQV